MHTDPRSPVRPKRNHRRPVTATAALLLLVAGLAACGDNAAPADVADGSTVPSASTEFPRDVLHALGTTTLEKEPVRVVTVGVTEQDAVLALGVVPVGVTEWYGEQPFATWPWAQDALGSAEPTVLSTEDGFDYERIAALDPDLIIGTNAGLDDESYDLLSAIAPTIAHPAGSELYFSPWDDQAEVIADSLGKGDEMATIIDDVQDQFATAAADHPEFAGQQIVLLQNAFSDGNAIAYQDGLSTAFLTDLGFTIPAGLEEFVREGEQAYIPMEQLSVLDDADILLWATEAPEDRDALESEPLYRGLEEVQSGQLVFTDEVTAGAIYFTSVLSLPFVLDQLVPALASTVAGDGPVEIDSTS